MSNTISVNLENLTDAERQQLMDIVEKSQKPKSWWEGTKFDVGNHKNYYYVCGEGIVECDTNENFNIDRNIIAFGNACKDKAYMERRAKEIKLYNLLSNFAEVVNEGWQPNWEAGGEKKYLIYLDSEQDEWSTTYTVLYKYPTEVYFKTDELAQRAIDEIVLPFERGEL